MTKENFVNVSNKYDLKWKMTSNGRLPHPEEVPKDRAKLHEAIQFCSLSILNFGRKALNRVKYFVIK